MSDARSVADRYAGYAGRKAGELEADLESFARLLVKWQRVQNLVSRETDEIWDRHVADSLQLLKYIPQSARSVLDLGSGSGFPALPLAVALKDRQMSFALVESNARKAAFLRAVARELHLPVSVHRGRIEQIAPRETSLITARALAPLADLLRFSAPCIGSATRALFHKGCKHGEELDKSRALWHFDVIVHPSETDPSGVILEISNLKAIAAA